MISSKLILGTVQFGLNYGIHNTSGKPSEEEVLIILEYAATHGIKILDTADAYGNATEILGSYLKSHPGQYKVNTKFRYNEVPLSDQLNTSLALLHVDRIDTFYYHRFDDFVNFPELLDELAGLKERKLIRKTGISIYENCEFEKALEHQGIDVIQLPFNLLDNLNQRGPLMRKARENGKELQVRSVFLQGLFFKPLHELPSKLQPLQNDLKTVHDIADHYRLPLENLALSYAMQQPEIDYVIIGVDNSKQLRKNIDSVNQLLPDTVIQKINQINVQDTELLYPKNWN